MRQHHTFRVAGRAGGVEQQGQFVVGDRSCMVRIGSAAAIAARYPRAPSASPIEQQVPEFRKAGDCFAQSIGQGRAGEDEPAPELAMMYRASAASSCGGIGTITAPIRQTAWNAAVTSGLFGIMTATRSPGRTPKDSKTVASRSARRRCSTLV